MRDLLDPAVDALELVLADQPAWLDLAYAACTAARREVAQDPDASLGAWCALLAGIVRRGDARGAPHVLRGFIATVMRCPLSVRAAWRARESESDVA